MKRETRLCQCDVSCIISQAAVFFNNWVKTDIYSYYDAFVYFFHQMPESAGIHYRLYGQRYVPDHLNRMCFEHPSADLILLHCSTHFRSSGHWIRGYGTSE